MLAYINTILANNQLVLFVKHYRTIFFFDPRLFVTPLFLLFAISASAQLDNFNKNKQLLFEKCKDGIAKHKLSSDNVFEIETFYNKTGRIHPDFEGILGKFE